MKVADANKLVEHVWSEPKSRLAMESPVSIFTDPAEQIDPEWWEPRYDQPWRRQVERDREAFGGAHVASPSPPIEGPNNPNRLRRELGSAKDRLDDLRAQEQELKMDITEALSHLRKLQDRVAETPPPD